MTYGFIITRHVNSEQTNKYWNHNIKLIRTHYPFKKIIIIANIPTNCNKRGYLLIIIYIYIQYFLYNTLISSTYSPLHGIHINSSPLTSYHLREIHPF